ncbi:MAG: molybdopterin molybdotransferase MoeA, partial [Planctomycetales bacterium]|nr:molybdopterin molybdotransferase MoeA [Planctomycetales bacterium]
MTRNRDSNSPTPQPASPSAPADVRMKGFAVRQTVDVAWSWIDAQVQPLSDEQVSLDASIRRTLARDIISQVNVPSFARAMMDGYAVLAEDTQGASSYNPLTLQVLGQSLPGAPYGNRVHSKQAVRIMTGAPMPDGADAVIPVEKTQRVDDQTIQVLADVSPQKHVGYPGEDIQQNSIVLTAGRLIRPQDLGVLSSMGVGQVPVIRRPRVRIIVTGNELLPKGTTPRGYQIADANGPMLRALVERDGGIVTNDQIIPDQPESILAAMSDEVDVVLVSGGSSVGQEDHAPRLLAEHGTLALHGLAMRPSSPSGMGTLDGRFVFLLPGNPVSCLCSYDFFAGRAIRKLTGRSTDWPYPSAFGTLERKLVSQVGRVDYARVTLRDDGHIVPIAIAGASILSSTTRADGFVIIPEDSEGFAEGTKVQVWLYG